MSATTYACPECQTTLKVSVPLAPGQKIKCPRCSTTFTPTSARPAPAPAQAIKQKPPVAPPRRAPLDEEEVSPPPRNRNARRQEDDEDTRKEKGEARVRQRESEEAAPRARTANARRALDNFPVEEEADHEDRPRAKKSKKPIKKSGSARGILIGVGAGVLLLLLLAGGAAGYYFWFYGVNRGSGDEDPLAYIPQDSNLVIGLDLATLLNDPILGPQIKQNMVKGANVGDDFIDRIKKETGLEAHELFARTTAAGKWDLSQGNQPGMKQGDTPYNFTIVLQTSKPFDQKKMAKAQKDCVHKNYKGMSYYEFKENNGEGTLFMPSNRTVVITKLRGGQAEAIIGSDGKSVLSSDAVTMIRGMEKNTVWMAFVPSDAERNTFVSELQKAPLPPDQKILTDALAKARAVGLFGQLETQGNQVKFGFTSAFGDEAGATEANKQLSLAWDKQKGEISKATLMLAIIMPKAKKLIDEAVKSVKFSTEGSTAQVTTQVNRTTATDLFSEIQKMGAAQAGVGQPGVRPGGGPPMPPQPPPGVRPGGRPKGGKN